MTVFLKNIREFSKYSLRISYRSIHNKSNNLDNNKLTNQENETDDNQPIILKENPFERERKICILCRLNITPDWKNVRFLSQFQSSYTGRIYGRHITGLCKKQQDAVEREILKAQHCGFMSIYHKNPLYMHDPKLFDPDHPFRPHKY